MHQERPQINRTESFKPRDPSVDLDVLDTKISDIIQSLERAGLNMENLNHEYENLPENLPAFNDFYDKVLNFKERREDALSMLEFDIDMTAEEKERIRQFDRDVINSFKDFDNFLGNGATAEVYGMANNDTVCVKFITDQERYNENNSIRKEHDYLSEVYERTKYENVRTPYPIFLRIHPREGHSYGMEKIKGASLSQLLEFPEKYPELIELAHRANRQKFESDLQVFIAQMHEAGVTHGDLFKRNLMIDEKGRLYVIDFGKARTIDFGNDREDARKSDVYLGRQELSDFFSKLDGLTS